MEREDNFYGDDGTGLQPFFPFLTDADLDMDLDVVMDQNILLIGWTLIVYRAFRLRPGPRPGS